MYRFIGVMKGREDRISHDILIVHKDFQNKEDALEHLNTYLKLNMPKAILTVIDKAVSLDTFFKKTFKTINKNSYSNSSLIKLEMVLNMEKIQENRSKNIDDLLGSRESILKLFDEVYGEVEGYPELGNLIFDNISEGVILGEPTLKVEL